MAASIAAYQALIAGQHRSRPAFMAALGALLQPVADNIATLRDAAGLYDIDQAVGAQLDVVGEWVGRSRALAVPLTGVYFAFDETGLGFDEGTWNGPFDPETGLVSLPDDSYRTVLRATIAANQWDGAIPSAYEVWDIVFSGTSVQILIQDNGDMSMVFGLIGPVPDAVTTALLTGGYLALKPAGVRIADYVIPSVPSAPIFGFDAETDSVGGFDSGGWATAL